MHKTVKEIRESLHKSYDIRDEARCREKLARRDMLEAEAKAIVEEEAIANLIEELNEAIDRVSR